MIRRTLVVDGALAPYVLVSVESCASRPSGDACPDATTLVKEHAPPQAARSTWAARTPPRRTGWRSG